MRDSAGRVSLGSPRHCGFGDIMKFHIALISLTLVAGMAPVVSSVATESQLSALKRQAVAAQVRGFILAVAQDGTQHGPTAWRAPFVSTPQFFMAVNGHLVFADSEAASRGIAALPSMIRRIELNWGDDLRVDPLTTRFAVVASSYSELQTKPDGTQTMDRGYFTAIAERGTAGWMFRDAHW